MTTRKILPLWRLLLQVTVEDEGDLIYHNALSLVPGIDAWSPHPVAWLSYFLTAWRPFWITVTTRRELFAPLL